MSGWRVVTAAAAAAHPSAIDAGQWHHSHIDVALQLGLIERVGRREPSRGAATHVLYRATEAGLLFASGRVTVAARHIPGARGRPRNALAATWLRALPDGVRMDLRPPRAAVSEWGGLPL